jgi:hypothetical protein
MWPFDLAFFPYCGQFLKNGSPVILLEIGGYFFRQKRRNELNQVGAAGHHILEKHLSDESHSHRNQCIAPVSGGYFSYHRQYV